MKRIGIVLAMVCIALSLPACKSGSPDSKTGASKKAQVELPQLIKSRTSAGGSGVNLNNSNIGLKGIQLMADSPDLKNVRTLALKTNQLGDAGMKILAESETPNFFQE